MIEDVFNLGLQTLLLFFVPVNLLFLVMVGTWTTENPPREVIVVFMALLEIKAADTTVNVFSKLFGFVFVLGAWGESPIV